MRLTCPNCEAQYEVPEDTIKPQERRLVQCSNCGQQWFQRHDGIDRVVEMTHKQREQNLKNQKAEREEAERIEAERQEAERIEAERQEAERIEAERQEAERIEAERQEAERIEAKRQEAERIEAERQEIENNKSEIHQAFSSHFNRSEINEAFPNFPTDKISTIEKIVGASPVELTDQDHRLGLRDKGTPEKGAPSELELRFRILKDHVQQILVECRQKQVPDDFHRRLSNYLIALEHELPVFLMLDGPMSFIQGSINDNYVTDGLDGGFIAACKLLVSMHEEIRPLLVSKEQSEAMLPELLPTVTSEDLVKIADSAIDVMSDPSVDNEVVEALRAAKNYFESALQNGTSRLGHLRRGIAAIGGIVSGAIAGALGTALFTWATSTSGMAVIARLRPIFEKIVALFA